MKKYISIFIILLVLFTNIEIISAKDFKFHLGEKVPNMRIESVTDSGKHNGIPFVLRRDDNAFVYCLDPFTPINTDDYYNSYNSLDKLFNLTKEQLNRMNLIAYYGYSYGNHTDLKWYGVTQFLVWKQLNLKDIYFTDDNKQRIVAYEDEIKEIETLVDDHYKLPSFANKHFEYTIDSTYEEVDLNNILKYYEIKNSNISSNIVDNKLYINTKEIGDYEITFVRKSPVNRDYILYGYPSSQPLLYPGITDDIEFKITIEVNSGSVTVNKFDGEDETRDFATLKGAIYGVYKEDDLITTIETNEEGIAYIGDLPLGKYYVKEITPSLGYKLDPNTYEFEITKETKDIVINSYENVIKGKLILNKYYGNDDNYTKEDNAVFEIYDINDNLIGRYETKDGKIELELDYGEYYIVQVSGKDDYKYVDKFEVTIDSEKEYSFDLYDEEEILVVSVPDTFKIDYNKFISIGLISIGLILIAISQKKTI